MFWSRFRFRFRSRSIPYTHPENYSLYKFARVPPKYILKSTPFTHSQEHSLQSEEHSLYSFSTILPTGLGAELGSILGVGVLPIHTF
jgi:hypothetical protein